MTQKINRPIVVNIANLSKRYNSEDYVFNKFNLKLTRKSTAIFGPNGCGKTTLLRIMSGLDNAFTGQVLYNNASNKQAFKIGYAFQDPSKFLFPWLNTLENISFPLKIKGVSKKQRTTLVKKLLKQFELNIPLDSYPYQLSGGQCQILVVLRSIVDSPDILFLDEPFSNLDYLNRTKFLFNLIHNRNHHPSTVFVSHTLEEGIVLADELILLNSKPAQVVDLIQIPFKKDERKPEMLKCKKFIDIKNKALRSLEKYI